MSSATFCIASSLISNADTLRRIWNRIRRSAGPEQNAEAMNRGDELGTLEVGKWADLIVLGADPRVNIRNLRSIEAVYIAGNPVAR